MQLYKAMSFPAEGLEGTWRNNIGHVKEYLDKHHKERYMVYNLTERSYNYDMLNNMVQTWCGFLDHHNPPLHLMFKICQSIDSWLSSDPKNVAIIHCDNSFIFFCFSVFTFFLFPLLGLAGKGRTGNDFYLSFMFFYVLILIG